MALDQYAFVDPTTRYPVISPPEQQTDEPGLESEIEPRPDLGETSYRGSGRLEGRKALITGADSGIGAAVAIAYAREGADVALSYLPEEKSDAERIAGLVRDAGRTALLLPGDVRDAAHCRSLITATVEGLGGIDILVSNAGKQVFQESIEEISDEQFDDTMKTNVYALFHLAKAAVADMPPGGTIITTASQEAYLPAPDLLDYAATKGAINVFSKALAQQLAPRGIRVNIVAPGPTWTALQVSEGQPPEKLPEFGQNSPLGRAGQPAELAPAYVFLASGESSYVVGSTLVVNGGKPTP